MILLVEDSPTTRLVISRQLARAGYPFDAVEDGFSALQAMERHRHLLVLTDVQMPGMGGLQLAKEIRKMERQNGSERIPILAITASESPEELEQCLAAGMDDCIMKPVSLIVLESKLRHWLPASAIVLEEPETVPMGKGMAPASAKPDSPVDLDVLGQLTRGNSVRNLEILQDYRDTTPAELAELRTAAAQGNRPEVARWAHRVKGSSKMVGAKAMGREAEALEGAARSIQAPDLEPLLSSLEAEFAAVARCLDEIFRSAV